MTEKIKKRNKTGSKFSCFVGGLKALLPSLLKSWLRALEYYGDRGKTWQGKVRGEKNNEWFTSPCQG